MNRLKMGAWHVLSHFGVVVGLNPDMVEQVWLKTRYVSVVFGVQITILAEKQLA